MNYKTNLHYSDVESANALRKLRLLLKMDQAAFSNLLETSEKELNILENVEGKVPDRLLLKAVAQLGIYSVARLNDRLDKMLDEAGVNLNVLVPAYIQSSEIFDLVNLYCLIPRENARLNIISIIKILACDKIESAVTVSAVNGAYE